MKLLIVLMCLMFGCSYIPAPKVLKQIKEMPYIKGKFVYWHKALAYHEYLKASEIKSRVVVGNPYKPVKKGVNHAWVEVEKNGKWYVIDPTDTNFDDGFEADKYWITNSNRTERRVVRE